MLRYVTGKPTKNFIIKLWKKKTARLVE